MLHNDIIFKSKLCHICYFNNIKLNYSKKYINKNFNNYIHIYNSNNPICIIFYNKTNIDICFKGTTTFDDIFTNIQIYPKKFINNKIKVHYGFLKKYLSVKNNIFYHIDNIIYLNNITDISLTGHSSGGAIANIATLDINDKYKNIKIKCVTFGSPRVGNKYFVYEYNKKINNSFRIVNKNDIIEHLPFPIIYQHIHEPIYLKHKKKFTIYQIFTNIYKYFKFNHNIVTYIRNLLD
jgi:hypothetical protein